MSSVLCGARRGLGVCGSGLHHSRNAEAVAVIKGLKFGHLFLAMVFHGVAGCPMIIAAAALGLKMGTGSFIGGARWRG